MKFDGVDTWKELDDDELVGIRDTVTLDWNFKMTES
jgi:hypothetical protein